MGGGREEWYYNGREGITKGRMDGEGGAEAGREGGREGGRDREIIREEGRTAQKRTIN